MKKEILITKIKKNQFIPFQVSDEELISFALEEAALIGKETEINGSLGLDLLKSFYLKRDNFRKNTRLGHILVQEYNISKDKLIKALGYHEETGEPLGEAFVKLNICTKEQINLALEKQSEMRNRLDYN